MPAEQLRWIQPAPNDGSEGGACRAAALESGLRRNDGSGGGACRTAALDSGLRRNDGSEAVPAELAALIQPARNDGSEGGACRAAALDPACAGMTDHACRTAALDSGLRRNDGPGRGAPSGCTGFRPAPEWRIRVLAFAHCRYPQGRGTVGLQVGRHAEPGITPSTGMPVIWARSSPRTRWSMTRAAAPRQSPSRPPRNTASTVLSSTWGWRVRAGRRRGEDDDVGLLGLAFEVGLGEALGDKVVAAGRFRRRAVARRSGRARP